MAQLKFELEGIQIVVCEYSGW